MTNQEINEAVARKLGWQEGEGPDGIKSWERVKNKKPNGLYETLDKLPVPADYCHSIEAAWEIVEWGTKNLKGCRFHLMYQPDLNLFGVGWFPKSDVFAEAIATIESAPKAICLAFLKLPQPPA